MDENSNFKHVLFSQCTYRQRNDEEIHQAVTPTYLEYVPDWVWVELYTFDGNDYILHSQVLVDGDFSTSKKEIIDQNPWEFRGIRMAIALFDDLVQSHINLGNPEKKG